MAQSLSHPSSLCMVLSSFFQSLSIYVEQVALFLPIRLLISISSKHWIFLCRPFLNTSFTFVCRQSQIIYFFLLPTKFNGNFENFIACNRISVIIHLYFECAAEQMSNKLCTHSSCSFGKMNFKYKNVNFIFSLPLFAFFTFENI